MWSATERASDRLNIGQMQIIRIVDHQKAYLPLLLLADEQEDMIDRYLPRGEMYALIKEKKALAVIVVTDEGEGVLEIKNLAVDPDAQRLGYGRTMIEFIEQQYRERYHTLLVGTGDSPLTVPFYEKCGFTRSHVIRDFFTEHYEHPIIEAGVLLRDMVVFKKRISGNFL